MGPAASPRWRARTLAFNAASVDITDQESTGRWHELLEGAGIKTARVSGSGIFKDAASDETIRGYFFSGTVRDKQFTTCRSKFANVPNFRGFPHVPGNDFMLSVASRTDKNDGKSRFK